MELTKFSPRTDILRVASEKNLIPQMDGKVKEIFMLLADRMIKDCTEVEIMNEVNDGIAKAMLIMGLNVKGETEEAVQERIVTVKMVTEEFVKHWGTFSIREIVYFFENLAKGYYGDFKIISLQNITQAMLKYWSMAERQSALKFYFSVEQKVLNPKTTLTQDDKDKIFKDKLVERFNQFSQAFRMNPNIDVVSKGFVDYDYLDTNKLITFDEATKKQFWTKAIDWVNQQKRDNANPEKASELTKHVVRMMAKDSKTYTITVAKEMLLCEAYKKLINKGRSIEELLK